MEIALWVIQFFLAVAFFFAGLVKATRPLEQLEEIVGGWVHDVPLPVIRVVGALEIVGAVGLVVPALVGVAPWLTWLSAIGLLVFMAGAVVIHGRRRESREVVSNLVLIALLVVVVWGRLGPHAF